MAVIHWEYDAPIPLGSIVEVLKFVRGYSYEELGKKLRMLRPPEGKRGGDWFSLGELNERLMKLREVEEKEKETEEKFVGFRFTDLRQGLVTLQLLREEENKKQGELNERLMKLREVEEKETEEKLQLSSEEKNKKQMCE